MSGHRNKAKGRSQAHQNTFAFRHNKNSKLTAKILAMPNRGLCGPCHEQIEWRKRYRKYKPLTTKGRCTKCREKTICFAYHTICDPCASKLHVCAKCGEKREIVKGATTSEEEHLQLQRVEALLASLPERKRRSLQRMLDRGDIDLMRMPTLDTSAADLEAFLDDDDDDEDDDDDDDDVDDDDADDADECDAEVLRGARAGPASGAAARSKASGSGVSPVARGGAKVLHDDDCECDDCECDDGDGVEDDGECDEFGEGEDDADDMDDQD